MNPLIKCIAIGAIVLSSAAVAEGESDISGDQLAQRLAQKDEVVILDVRTPEEFAAGHVPGARNIPHDQLPNRLAELAGAKDKEVIVYCRTGRRAEMAQETLKKNGFKRIVHLDGDMVKWQEEERPVEK